MSSKELLKKAKEALSLEARMRFKSLKQIEFQALEEFKSLKNLSIEELNNYREIFSIVKKVPGISNRYRLGLTKIINKYLQLLGCENPRILFKKSTGIELNSGTISIGDPSYSSEADTAYAHVAFETELIKLVNCGKAYFFFTGGDGLFDIQVRIVESPEPALTSKEYRNVVGASPTVILSFPTGKLAIDDGMISPSKNQIEVDITPGNYKCQIFTFKFPKTELDYSFYTVLAKCETSAVNDENEIITLEPDF